MEVTQFGSLCIKDAVFLFFFAGIDEISVDAYKGVEHSDSEDSEKSDSSDSEDSSDVEQKAKNNQDAASASEAQEETPKKDQTSPEQDGDSKTEKVESEGDSSAVSSDALNKETTSKDSEKDNPEKAPVPASHGPGEKTQGNVETSQPVPVEDSDSERELVIDLGDDQEGKDRKRSKKDNSAVKDSSAGKCEGVVKLFHLLILKGQKIQHVTVKYEYICYWIYLESSLVFFNKVVIMCFLCFKGKD